MKERRVPQNRSWAGDQYYVMNKDDGPALSVAEMVQEDEKIKAKCVVGECKVVFSSSLDAKVQMLEMIHSPARWQEALRLQMPYVDVIAAWEELITVY